MIEERKCYIMKCDGCGDMLVSFNDLEPIYYSTIKKAKEDIKELGWTTKGKKVFCPACGKEGK